MSRVIVIGGGASGMMAVIAAKKNGNDVTLLEKNEKLGKKLFITGKGRCNLTNASDINSHMNNLMSNPKFMYSAFNAFDSDDIISLIEESGVKTKVERGNRVFPKSDKSSDVIKALKKQLDSLGVSVVLNYEVKDITKDDEFKINDEYTCDSLIIATGGLSYKSTGSTGDGYKWARQFNHKTTKTYPSLVPFNIQEGYCKELQGLSLKNVNLKLLKDDKTLYEDLGEMIFTHFGVSGPLVLSASSFVADKMEDGYKISIDLKPALDEATLDKRILRDFDKYKNKNFNNSLNDLLPKKLIPIIIRLSGIDEYKKVNEITKEERQRLVGLIKNLEFNIESLRGYDEAIITKGGIDVKEINPKTMESKIVPGLYFVGEVLDLDSLTGGYNLQLAWSTGFVAGNSIY
ncbi:MAG TPA: aminoacetone oxidase family FAD-binding enzyme [Eubacterium sp.]|nr:aminoacetone oxidase family FAD-binding enzyme [Eubacterium sp.]